MDDFEKMQREKYEAILAKANNTAALNKMMRKGSLSSIGEDSLCIDGSNK